MKKGQNPHDARELNKMLGKMSYHLNVLVENGDVVKKNLGNATIYTTK
ncbi:MAG: hypothetical protein ABIG95_05060 [Candidatus Woesearchaeota archaeon]